MDIRLYEQFLAKCFEIKQAIVEDSEGGKVVREGLLISKDDKRRYPIRNYIPRFVGSKNYADSFGLQWNRFKKTQFDSHTGKPLTADRFWKNTKWEAGAMSGKKLLEVGSGAGRFTEILLQIDGLTVVSMDYSNAVDANYENNKTNRLFLFQGDLYDMPLEKRSFDYVFCYGVLQHTPAPEEAFHAILEFLKPGGLFSVDVYRRMYIPVPWYFPKYFWRPLTTKLAPATLLKIIEFYIPLWLPIDTMIKKIPKLGSYLAGILPIPCWNYWDLDFGYSQRLEWAVMDTFDALAAKNDFPQRRKDIEMWCNEPCVTDVDIFFGSNGIVANGRAL